MNLERFRQAVRTGSIESLQAEIQALETPQAIALIGQLKPGEAIVFLRLLGKDVALETFEELSAREQAAILEGLEAGEIASLLRNIEPSDLIDLLDELPAKVVKKITLSVTPEAQTEISLLMGFPEGSVGRAMSPRYLAVRSGTPIRDVLERVRESALDPDDLDVVFVIDTTRRYLGFVRVPELVRANPERPVESLLKRAVRAVAAHDPLPKATEAFRTLGIPVLPVVDKEARLIGCIRAAEAIELVEQEEASRLAQFGGAMTMGGPDIDLRSASLPQIYRARVIWLAILTFFGVITSTYVAHQEEILGEILVLAAFIAPIIDMGGNTGSQSATMVIRAMALGQIRMDWHSFWFALRRDLMVAGALAVTIGVLEIILAYFSKGVGFDILLVVGLTMFIVTILGSLIGLCLPFLARRFGVDPATLSAPAITSIMDLLGVVIYFGLAALFLSHLLT